MKQKVCPSILKISCGKLKNCQKKQVSDGSGSKNTIFLKKDDKGRSIITKHEKDRRVFIFLENSRV